MALIPREKEHIHALSELTLNPSRASEVLPYVSSLNDQERCDLVSLADSNHVVMRAVEPLRLAALACGDSPVLEWVQGIREKESARIANALRYLDNVCKALEDAGCQVVVMKSLDHWPDLGNDLDLYSTADDEKIKAVMTTNFQAKVEHQSWGDRLAHKWNFSVPGLPEAIEVHAKRLGQTGEHTAMARRFVTRRVPKEVGGYTFLVPAPEERIIVATLQRMYRHFYFRVCDVANTAALVESGAIDFAELKKSADLGGIWLGVCSYLRIVSDYVKQYRGHGVDLPHNVVSVAPFGGEVITVRGRFLRVPIMPKGAELYARQVTETAFRGDVPATFRLTLLPYLAGAAAISYKLTGSDKGIW